MKKLLVSIAVLSMICAYSCVSADAVVATENKDKGYISVNTSADMELAPDTADIYFAVKTSDSKSMQKATAQNKEISDKVLAELKSLINPATGDYIKTSDFNASPVYTYSGQKRNLDKYEVSNRVMVHTKSIDRIGKMIDNAITAGATNVDSLSFSVSNYDTKCDELISKAGKKAYNRANTLSKAVNTSIVGISSISASCSTNGNTNYPRMYMAKNMLSAAVADSAAAEGAGISISNGVIKINANVNASFYVK